VVEGSEIVGGGLDTGTGGATDLTGVLCVVRSSGWTLAVLPQQPIGSGSQGETRKNGGSVLHFEIRRQQKGGLNSWFSRAILRVVENVMVRAQVPDTAQCHCQDRRALMQFNA
jgi:hypothetical protein